MGLDAVHPGLLVNYNTDGMAITMRNAVYEVKKGGYNQPAPIRICPGTAG
jgi:hypothetical protein